MPLYLGKYLGQHFGNPGRHILPIPYAELHCISNYSFLRGASHPEELVQQASEMGYQAIAITDECSYSGLVKAHKTAKACRDQADLRRRIYFAGSDVKQRGQAPFPLDFIG